MLFPHEPKRPWYFRLWRWFFPVKTPEFTKITMPMCFYTHPRREDLVRLLTEPEDK